MKRTIRTLTLVLAVQLAMTMAACTNTGGEPSAAPTTAATSNVTAAPTAAPTPEPTPAEPVVISLLMSGDNTPSSYNDVLQEVQRRTGYIMDVTYVVTADYQTKLNAMIASQTLPDIIRYSMEDGTEFRDNGVIIELTDLLNEYGTDILADKGELNTGLNAGDGIWGVPYGLTSILNSNLSVRTDWLANLGLSMPTDLDSLYTVMKAFTNDDPNRNEIKDTIGIGLSLSISKTFTHIFGAYGIPIKENIQLEDGTVTTYLRHPNFLDAIQYIRTLYQEGLMETEFATIPNTSSYEKLWNGIYGMYDFQAAGTTNNWLGRYTEDPIPTFDFATIVGPGGIGGSVENRQSSYWGITSICEYPQDAMALANYLTTEEGDELLLLGIEGVHYRWIDKDAGTFEYIPPYDDSATHRNAGGYVYNSYFIPDHNCAQFRSLNPQTRHAVELASMNYIPDAHIYGSLEANKEYGDTLNSIVNEAIAQLIVSNGDIEQLYQDFVDRWLVEGGEAWQQEATQVYHAENSK